MLLSLLNFFIFCLKLGGGVWGQFSGINMFWTRLRRILARAVRRGLKWALRRAQDIFMHQSIPAAPSLSSPRQFPGIGQSNPRAYPEKFVDVFKGMFS